MTALQPTGSSQRTLFSDKNVSLKQTVVWNGHIIHWPRTLIHNISSIDPADFGPQLINASNEEILLIEDSSNQIPLQAALLNKAGEHVYHSLKYLQMRRKIKFKIFRETVPLPKVVVREVLDYLPSIKNQLRHQDEDGHSMFRIALWSKPPAKLLKLMLRHYDQKNDIDYLNMKSWVKVKCPKNLTLKKNRIKGKKPNIRHFSPKLKF